MSDRPRPAIQRVMTAILAIGLIQTSFVFAAPTQVAAMTAEHDSQGSLIASPASRSRPPRRTQTPIPATAVIVSPAGSDANPGTVAKPYRTVLKGLSAVRPGGTLLIRGGTYRERVKSPLVARGTATSRVSVTAYPGEKPVIEGLLWLTNASYWNISGLTVRWSLANNSSEHMVKMISGVGWVFEGNTVEGARSYSGLLVCGTATGWTVRKNIVRDSSTSNGINQDHLVYVNTTGTNGLIEHNILENSPNGQAIKVGPPSASEGSVTGLLTIRYNTMRSNLGPSNVQLSHLTSNVDIHHNIFDTPRRNRSAVAAWDLFGTNNTVHDNVYWNAARVVDLQWSGLRDTGGNRAQEPAGLAALYGAGATL